MAFVEIGGFTHHVSVRGPEGGPVLVFSNSLGTDFRIWDKVIARLPDSFRVMKYDKRGHGLSELSPAPYRMETLVGDVATTQMTEALLL